MWTDCFNSSFLPRDGQEDLDAAVEAAYDLPWCEQRRTLRDTAEKIRNRYEGIPDVPASIWQAEGAGLKPNALPNYLHQQVRGQHSRSRRKNCASTLTTVEWRTVLKAFDDRCAYCQRRGQMHIDHLHPISEGGPNILENVVPSCRRCNSSKGAKGLAEWLRLSGQNVTQVMSRIAQAHLTITTARTNG